MQETAKVLIRHPFYGALYTEFKKSLHNQLYADTSSYFMVRSREDGENDLARLALCGKREAGLVFSHDTDTWYNVTSGYNETDDWKEVEKLGRDMYRFKNMPFLGSYQTIPYTEYLGKRVTHYHTHPLEHDARCLTGLIKAAKKSHLWTKIPSKRELSKMVEKIHTLHTGTFIISSILPSIGDIDIYAHMMYRSGESELNFKVVSPYGVTTILLEKYSDTEKIINGYMQSMDAMLRHFRSLKDDTEISDRIAKTIKYANGSDHHLQIKAELFQDFDYNNMLELLCDRILEIWENESLVGRLKKALRLNDKR